MSSGKIMAVAVFFVLGWVWAYLFLRQIWFNFETAYPTLKKMKAAKEDLIVYINASRYTTVSVFACFFVASIFVVVILLIKIIDLPLELGFLAGAVCCLLMLIGKMGPENRNMFDAFCNAYYRFVPDDQLRTDMYNKKVPAMKLRCHDMGVSTDWIPEFKKEDKN